ncbi:mitochondrial glutamate carrier 2-like [Amphiura filiformis]|uniref:mitochondrial glutamate carrier 2-like n=1 Tax=Amphiura filiformis TaxID=82378 RepID=UPI003B213559
MGERNPEEIIRTLSAASAGGGAVHLPAKIVNGAVAGIVGVTCVFPIDLVKTRLQNQQVINGHATYNNLFDCFKKVAKADGFLGLYKGYGVNVTLITPEKAITLVGNDFFRQLLLTEKKTVPREILAGAGAGLCQIIVTTPMEMLKIQLQDSGRSADKVGAHKVEHVPEHAHHHPRKPHGTRGFASGAATEAAMAETKPSALAIARELIKTEGIRGVYRGFFATCARDVPFSAIYFPMFAHLNAMGIKEEGGKASFGHSFVAGCFSATLASLVVNPIDVIKTRLQLIDHAHGDHTYTGIRDCATTMLRHEGVKAFFKGAMCRAMVIAPLFGIAQGVYYVGVGEYILGVKK